MEQIADYRVTSNGNIPKGSLTKEIGSSGQRERFGIVQSDFLTDWRTTQAKVITVDRMVKNSPLIGGALRLAIEMSIRKVDWFFTSGLGSDDPDLDLVQRSMDNLTHSWTDFISDIVLSAFYGWTTFTNKYQRVGNEMLWRKFKMLGHETHMEWLYAEDGGLLGLQQYPHLWQEPIPIERILLFRFRFAGGNPEGESILRPAWTSYYYGSNLEEIRAIGYERHAAGMPMVKMPYGSDGDTSSEDTKKAQEIARNIRVDEQGGLVIPPPTTPDDNVNSRWDVELMSAGNAQVFMALNSTISEYDQKVLIAALAQFIILGINGVGTQAKAETDVSFFTMAVDAFADNIADTFTQFAVKRLLKLNGRETDNIKLEHSPAGDVDTAAMTEFIKVVGGGITWTSEDEQQIRSIFGMPDKSQEELDELKQEQATADEERLQRIEQQLRSGQNQPVERDDNALALFEADNAPALFEADNSPDDGERRKMEGRWQRAASKYFGGALKRVTNGARSL